MYKKNAHCSYCGEAFAPNQSWPRTCARCAQVTYRNPLPVAVLLLPIGQGLLAVRRAIEPGSGKLAFPGGYINFGETWQEACARELLEETGIGVSPLEIREFRVLSTRDRDGALLIFGLAPRRPRNELPTFVPTEETTEIVVLGAPQEMAFPLHTQVMKMYFTQGS